MGESGLKGIGLHELGAGARKGNEQSGAGALSLARVKQMDLNTAGHSMRACTAVWGYCLSSMQSRQ